MLNNVIHTFNPVKEETGGIRAKRVVWSTDSITLAIQALTQGKKLVANPFIDNNVLLLKGDLVFNRTQEEITEWQKCARDIIYFIEKYCKIMTPSGVRNVELRDYQKEYLELLQNNRLTILCSARQAGKTVTSALYMLHYICFNIDKTAMILGNRKKTAIEVLTKAKDIYLQLPYFLKAGVYKWNESELVLDNGCRILCDATTETPAIGFTIHCLLWDEAAHIRDSIAEIFYGNMFPTLQASQGKMMITSTTNGRNLFYRLFKAAQSGESDFVAYEVTWDKIPDWDSDTHCWRLRDDKWKQKQIGNLGSIEQFNKQFGTDFDIGTNTLISNNFLKQLKTVKYFNKDINGVCLCDFWYWHPKYDPMTSLKNDYIVITCDLSEGINKDYNVFQIFKLENKKLIQVGYFHCNDHLRSVCAESLVQILHLWSDPNRYLISFEKNTYGDLFYRELLDLSERYTNFDFSNLVKYKVNETRTEVGIKITSANKPQHCQLFKEALETQQIEISDTSLFFELQNFEDVGNHKYRASFGHDDLVMATIQLMFVKETLQYRLFEENSEISSDVEKYWNPYLV